MIERRWVYRTWLVVAVLAGACTPDRGGDVRLAALGAKRLVLEQSLHEGVFANLDSEHGFWLSDVSLDTLAQGASGQQVDHAIVLHAQLVWRPEPGLTPITPTATNTVLRVMVVSKGEVGIYAGAGFARPVGDLDATSVELDIRGGVLTLVDSTPGFHDLLSPTDVTGIFKAQRSDDGVQRWRRTASQFATNALGKPMWVLEGVDPAPGIRLSLR